MSQNVNVNVVNVIGSNSPTSDSCGCGGCLAMLLVIGAVGWAVSFYSDQPAQPPAPTVNEPAALNAATMPAGPRVPDLKDKLDALQKDLANARHDLDAVSRAVLDDLRLRPQYQEVKKDLDYWTAEDQTTKASHRHAKEFATQQRTAEGDQCTPQQLCPDC